MDLLKLLLVMAIFLVIYRGTENCRWVMNLAVGRNILTFVPMAYFVASLTSIELLRSGSSG